MATYNREFLVPYLQDLCTLHLARNKLMRHYNELQAKVQTIQCGKDNPYPNAPTKEPVVTVGRVIAILLGAFCSIALLACFVVKVEKNAASFKVVMFICGVVGICIILAAVSFMKGAATENEKRQIQHLRCLEQYRKINDENKKAKEQIPFIMSEAKQCSDEMKKVDIVLNSVYRANIIPMQYRNFYAAVYLYDYFRGSREDNLASALSTFVLEQIKEKLDTIIANQSEMLLNQRIMIANQERSLAQQNEHNRMMRAKVDRLQASADERNQYLSMIESNTAATAYFAAADYLRRI